MCISTPQLLFLDLRVVAFLSLLDSDFNAVSLVLTFSISRFDCLDSDGVAAFLPALLLSSPVLTLVTAVTVMPALRIA